MLLRQISNSDPVTALVLEGLEKTCPILRDVQFYSKKGPSDNVKKASAGNVSNTVFRDLNEPVTTTPGARAYTPIAKKILSIESKVDVILEDRGEDPESELAHETRLDAMEAGWFLQDKFFYGDSATNSKEFDGIVQIVPSGNVQTPAANGIQVPVGNSDTNVGLQQSAVEELLAFFDSVRGGATHAYMPDRLKVRWMTVAKNLGYYRQSKDALGNLIDIIGETVIRGAGKKKDGTSILQFNETVGTSTDCSSIFAVRWGEKIDLTVLTTRGVITRYLGQVAKFIVNSTDLEATIVLQNDTALYRSKGWRL